ncbi:MAG: flippase [Treponema sp.]|nr:flippase [Treponema sp.]
MEEKSIKKNSIFNILTKILGMIFPMITFPYASRVLLPDGLGKINFANSVIDIFVILASLGIGAHAIREASKARDDRQELSKLATEIIVINLATMTISFAIFAIALIFSQKLQDYKILLFLASARILLATLGLEWLIVSQEEFSYIARRTFVFQLISIAFLFTFVRSPKDINYYMLFTVLSAAGANICNFFYSRKFFDFSLAQKLEIKKHFKPIFALSASVLASSVYTILDKTMIGIMRTDAEVGYYSAAIKINRMFILVFSAIVGVLLPRLSYYMENDKEKYKTLLNNAANILQALSIPMAIGLALLARPIILLFCGKNYENAITCMQILCFTVFVTPFNTFIADLVFVARRKNSYVLYPVVLGACVNFVMNLVLIPRYGITGAAVASITSEALMLAVKIFLAYKTLGGTLYFFSKIYQYAAGTLVMALAVVLLMLKLDQSVATVILEAASGALVYALVLLAFRNEHFLGIVELAKRKILRRTQRP